MNRLEFVKRFVRGIAWRSGRTVQYPHQYAMAHLLYLERGAENVEIVDYH